MPDIRIYLPDKLYMRLQQEENKSRTVQDALIQFWKIKESKK